MTDFPALVRAALSPDRHTSDRAFSLLAREMANDIDFIRYRYRYARKTEFGCDEIRQVCLEALWETCQSYDFVRPFPTFANTIMRNRVASECKRIQRQHNSINYAAGRFTDLTPEHYGADSFETILTSPMPATVDMTPLVKLRLGRMERNVLNCIRMLGAGAYNPCNQFDYPTILECHHLHYGDLTWKQLDNVCGRIREKAKASLMEVC